LLSLEIQENIKTFKPFFVKSAVKDLFSWEELETLINLQPMCSRSRFYPVRYKGERDPRSLLKINWEIEAWNKDPSCFPNHLRREFIKEAICYFTDTSKANKKINTVCAEIETVTGMNCDAHIYFDLRKIPSTGFPIHNDRSHNIIIQVEGSSHVRVWEHPCLTEDQETKDPGYDPIVDVLMEPGDLVFVPIRHWHEFVSNTQRLSISFPFNHIGDVKQQRDWIDIKELVVDVT